MFDLRVRDGTAQNAAAARVASSSAHFAKPYRSRFPRLRRGSLVADMRRAALLSANGWLLPARRKNDAAAWLEQAAALSWWWEIDDILVRSRDIAARRMWPRSKTAGEASKVVTNNERGCNTSFTSAAGQPRAGGWLAAPGNL